MRNKYIIFLLVLVSVATGCATTHTTFLNCATYQTCFSPDGGCASTIINELGKAKVEILVQAYYLTAPDICQALADAHKRGIHMEIILDASRSKTNTDSCKEASSLIGIPIYLDTSHPHSHNKVMIIDKEVVVTGSYNFTGNAERNAENVLILRSMELAKEYIENWERHKGHSEVYGKSKETL